MSLCPLTVPEARAILMADEALEATFPARADVGKIMDLDENAAWVSLVKSANDRVAAYEDKKK